jgi:WD40 repeat protein
VKRAQIWDTNTGECIRKMTGHTSVIWQMMIYSDIIFTSSDDKVSDLPSR